MVNHISLCKIKSFLGLFLACIIKFKLSVFDNRWQLNMSISDMLPDDFDVPFSYQTKNFLICFISILLFRVI